MKQGLHFFVVALVMLAACCASTAFAVEKPNVLFIAVVFEPSLRVSLIVVDPRKKTTAGQECSRTVQLLLICRSP